MWEWPAAFRTDTDIPGWPGKPRAKDRQAEGSGVEESPGKIG